MGLLDSLFGKTNKAEFGRFFFDEIFLETFENSHRGNVAAVARWKTNPDLGQIAKALFNLQASAFDLVLRSRGEQHRGVFELQRVFLRQLEGLVQRDSRFNMEEFRIVWGSTYGDVEEGQAVVHVDSHGQIAIAVRSGRADEAFSFGVGDTVVLGRPDGGNRIPLQVAED